jgi:hypothetical protein
MNLKRNEREPDKKSTEISDPTALIHKISHEKEKTQP